MITPVLQNPDVKHVSNDFSLQSQPAARSGRLETTPKPRLDGGIAATSSSSVGFSLEDETAKMALLLGSFQKDPRFAICANRGWTNAQHITAPQTSINGRHAHTDEGCMVKKLTCIFICTCICM